MAQDVLAILVFTVISKFVFNTRGRVLDLFRSSLSLKVVESLICTQDCIRSSTTPMSIEEDLNHVEQLEEGKLIVTLVFLLLVQYLLLLNYLINFVYCFRIEKGYC